MTPFRPLLPAVRPWRTPPVADQPKTRQVAKACESCRRHKSRCDGTPTCAACVKRQSICRYDLTETRQIRKKHERLQQRHSTYEDLIELLRTRTEQDVAELLLRLRAGADVESIVKHARNGNLHMQLSLIPETTRRYEFPYLAKMPDHLFVSDNPYLRSLLYRTLFNPSKDAQPEEPRPSTPPNSRQSTYTLPYHTVQMVDPLLEKITTTPWTNIISDDRMLRRLIATYFCSPHPCGPLVHKDLFLEDMAVGGTCFCSPVLVNAMLAIATQMCLGIPDRVKMWHPESLTYKFLAEARRLWDLESLRSPRIPTIQAAVVMSVFYADNSLDQVSTMFLERALTMAEQIRLFEASSSEDNPRMSKARTFTAWKIFSWQTMFDYSFFRPPHMRHPPQMPLPEIVSDPQWYGEILVQYPHDLYPTSLHIGHQMQSEARLYMIINEFGFSCFGEQGSRSLTCKEILALKRRLDEWNKALPEPLRPRALVLPLHFSLHIQYHQTIIALMQMILSTPSDNAVDLNLGAGKSALSVIRDSEIMLESLMRLYYMRHSFDLFDPWVTVAMIMLGNKANALLDAQSHGKTYELESIRSTIILSAKAFESQAENFHVAASLNTLFQGTIKPEVLGLVQTHVKVAMVSQADQDMIAQHPHTSRWPLPISSINDNPENIRLCGLVDALKETRL